MNENYEIFKKNYHKIEECLEIILNAASDCITSFGNKALLMTACLTLVEQFNSIILSAMICTIDFKEEKDIILNKLFEEIKKSIDEQIKENEKEIMEKAH